MSEVRRVGRRPPRGSVYALCGAVAVLMACNAYLFHQIQALGSDTATLRLATIGEITNFREAAAAATQVNRRRLDDLRQELEAARRQASVAAGQAKREAQAHAEQLARQLAQVQRQQREQLAGELSSVRAVTVAAAQRIGEVSTDVSGMKTETTSTRSGLEKTIADLRRMKGDLGVMSGLIATNSRELVALKARGDREYFDFELAKGKQPRKIADIVMVLKKTDPKRYKYTLELVADDKRIEKKDRHANEPVQFYVGRGRVPYEIVVNEVGKDQVRGYLAVPKIHTLRELTALR